MSDYLKIHPQPCQCPFCESERRWAKKQSELASAPCSAAACEQERDVLNTYRRIWERLPERQRHDMMASMRCWSPVDYEIMVAEEQRQNAELTHREK